MRMFVLGASLLGLAVSLSAQDPNSDQDTTKKPVQAFHEFQRQYAGDWIAQWHPATGTPSAIYGTGLPLADWRENSLAEARRHALLQIQQHHDLLGLGTSELRESIGARMGRTWSFKFDQYFRGLPVIGGRVDVRINMKGVVAMLGSQAFPIAADFGVVPTIGEETAVANAWAALGQTPTNARQPAPIAAPRLVVWGDAHAERILPVHLAWEVAVSNVDQNGKGAIGRYYVDAHDGSVLEFRNDKHECGLAGCTAATHAKKATPPVAKSSRPPVPTVVTLQAWTRTGLGGASALVNVPLPGVEVAVPGVGTFVTNASGQITIDIASPVTITFGALNGRHHQPLAGTNNPTGSFLVNPGVATTMQLSSAAATSLEAAHATTSFWIDRTNEFARSVLGNSSQLITASNLLPTVNITSDTCNAFYSGNTLNFYAAGGSCVNMAFSTVVAHEWGHGLDDRYGGISNTPAEGLSEGTADIVAMYLTDQAVIGSGFAGGSSFIRTGNNTRVYPFADAVAPHPAGEVWMGFAWQLRQGLRTAYGTTTAVQISNDIVIGSIVADATTRVNAVREVFIADDDDGNLLNGTPNYTQLSAAAIAKAIPYPEKVVGTVTHTPLATTTQRLTPRMVNAVVTPVGGSFSTVRLHYNAGTGNLQRNMKPNGVVDGYRAMLPGITQGTITYHIEAVHSTGQIVRAPASGEWSFDVNGGNLVSFFSENFDGTVLGWTAAATVGTSDWQLGDPNGKTSVVNGVTWIDPQTAASGANCFANDLGIGTSNGRYPNNVNQFLRSPTIDCSGRTGVRLRFRRWLSIESGQYDQATVSVNGTTVWSNPTLTDVLDTAWQTVDYALPMADNNPAVQIEWRLVSDGGVNYGGWQIDDVQLLADEPVAVPANLTLIPEQAVQGGAMLLTIQTPGNSRPFVFIIGDTIGPTFIPGLPILLVGGASFTGLPGTTDASGNASAIFAAPAVPSAVGALIYSQVLTVDATFTQFVTSNPYLNLITQTL